MKFKKGDIVYVVWDCDDITKERILSIDGNCYVTENHSYSDDKDTFAVLKEARLYARELLDEYIFETSKYIDNIKPLLTPNN